MRRRFASDCPFPPAVAWTLPPKDAAAGYIEPETVGRRLRIVAEGPKANSLYRNGQSGSEMHPMLAEAVWTWEGTRRRRTHQQSMRSALASQVGDEGTSPTSSRKREAWSQETTQQVVSAKKQRVLERHGHQGDVVAPFGCQMPGGPLGSPLQDEDMDPLDIETVLDEMIEMDEDEGLLDTSGLLEQPPDSATTKADKFRRFAKKTDKEEAGQD